MPCCQYHAPVEGGATTFTVQMPRVTFGRGTLGEAGERALGLGMRRAAVFTDPGLSGGPYVDTVLRSLSAAGVDPVLYDEVQVEPGDRSVMAAAAFLADGGFNGVVTVGGGSSIDTAKAAMLYARYPVGSCTDYFGPPVGGGVPVPGPMLPHLVCPTTAGTGSEVTGITVIRLEELNTKFVVVSRHLLPDEALIDPVCAQTLPRMVLASTGFDLMSHAIECFTARAYTRWPRVDDPLARPMIQGSNPWSELHAAEALRRVGLHLARAVQDPADYEARDSLSWAATLAGIAFGNSGTHMPHALSYAVAEQVRDYHAPDYPGSGPFVPHGIGVISTAPSVFRFTAGAAPERHLDAAAHLGAVVHDAVPGDAGEAVAGRIIELMRAAGVPNGLAALGYSENDAPALAKSAIRQRRAIGNAPRDAGETDVERIFRGAMHYWQ